MNDWKYILIPIISVVLAQILKFGIETFKTKKINIARLFNGNGGMPSSHTAFTFSLTFAIGLEEGFTTPLFAVSLIIACIVAYDSMGLRMESGKQAQAINLLMEKSSQKSKNIATKKLQEQLGHKPFEVMMGIIFGFFVAFVITYFC